MSSLEFVGGFETLVAPRRDMTALLMPSWESLRSRFSDACASWSLPVASRLGEDLGAWRREARVETLEAARRYTQTYRDVAMDTSSDAPLVLGGHQPQLFHPGVWFKNGMLSHLGQHLGAIPINLVIDNDVCRSVAIRVPCGDLTAPHWEQVPLDLPSDPIPFEDRWVGDEAMFREAASRIRAAMPSWLEPPMIESLWHQMPVDEQPSAPLGARLAMARHRFESRWSWRTWEVPLSHLCEGRAFRRFAFVLWRQASKLLEDHNQELFDYRSRYRIRSRSHPVPALERDGEFSEVPFWIWTAERTRRRRLFVRAINDRRLELTDRDRWRCTIDRDSWLNEGWGLNPEKIRIRSRALTTTWFARSLVAPGFLHGLGGALYDRLTDAIVRRHWGLELSPAFAATSTLRLKPNVAWEGPTDPWGWEQLQRTSRGRSRDFRFHPESFLQDDSSGEPVGRELAERKRRMINERQTVDASDWESRRRLHEAIEGMNQQLRERMPERAMELQREEQHVESLRGVARVLGSREYAFALFSEERLGGAFRAWLEGVGV